MAHGGDDRSYCFLYLEELGFKTKYCRPACSSSGNPYLRDDDIYGVDFTRCIKSVDEEINWSRVQKWIPPHVEDTPANRAKYNKPRPAEGWLKRPNDARTRQDRIDLRNSIEQDNSLSLFH